MKLFWRRNLSNLIYCHFCPQNVVIDPNSLICSECGQYNGFDDNQPSGYDQRVQNSVSSPVKKYCVPLKGYHRVQPNFLCWECLKKQELWRIAIANIENCAKEDSDMQLSSHEKRELERIEQTYGLCRSCQSIVRQRLSFLDQKLSNQWLNFYMARSSRLHTGHSSTECNYDTPKRGHHVYVRCVRLCLMFALIGYALFSGMFWRYLRCIHFLEHFELFPFHDMQWTCLRHNLFQTVWWTVQLAFIYSIYQSLQSNLLYPYLFCYCTLSSFLLFRNWFKYNGSWIFKGWICLLYLRLWRRRANSVCLETQQTQSCLENSLEPPVTDKLCQLPRALSTLSLQDVKSDTATSHYMDAQVSSLPCIWNRIPDYFPFTVLSLYQNGTYYLFQQYPMRTCGCLFFVMRIVRLIYLARPWMEWLLNITSWMIVFLIWLHPCAQLIHCFQQIVLQTSYHPFDSKLYQQWHHPLRNAFLLYLSQFAIITYFMVTVIWRDISLWIEWTYTSISSLTTCNKLFLQVVHFVFQEYGIRMGIVVVLWMSIARHWRNHLEKMHRVSNDEKR